ncbi:pre-mRNA splicing factor cef-1 [Viridothelium virens]|uniref:Pre-mRNA splicing factor cef-1 n=1 Tax=Viridothelium virens TaxID=1048519 RepID=A0A6A6GX70_VIRVR|nr:pre-mRNA splicing factor cef-1 [Viridothelium virens]
MPVVKGGVWTNIEDEILKASVSKYGLNQWARVSSLLARKTPKQCKARWAEWLDPGIRKIEWSKEEDERLLHLAKLMPTQWRTIAPIVGRTATQCLERYQKLLDEAESRENDELRLGGPEGGETAAPSAEDVRRLRPGEMDPDPESKPAKPDTIDLDEDEKEMLSEARARLANTQGKKAKRKARERQLDESRRLAQLQKRREMKAAGINIKINNVKKGQMDYNADIPFEKAPAPGFYDTNEENEQNERQREEFDPRKQQLANKRKQDQEDPNDDRKRQKNDKVGAAASAVAAAAAGKMQKIREAEQSSKRRKLVLPAPQVKDAELEDIVKMGMAGERASQTAISSENDATRGLVGNYSSMTGATPIRTPMAAKEEDRVANEARNAIARTGTQSALFGGENTPLQEQGASTGFEGVAPSKQQLSTPNPLATPFRQGGPNGVGATPMRGPGGPGATPMRTPRDNFRLNQEDGSMQLVGQTPRDIKLRENAMRQSLAGKLAALPKPRENDFELELPEEQEETVAVDLRPEDSAVRDQRNRELQEAAERAEFRRESQVVQKALPRPSVVDIDAMLKNAANIADPLESAVAKEMALLVVHDAVKFRGAKVDGSPKPLEVFDDEALEKAKMEIALEMAEQKDKVDGSELGGAWDEIQGKSKLPGLGAYGEDEVDEEQLMVEAYDNVHEKMVDLAQLGNKIEKKLGLTLGGYQQRAKTLRQKIVDAAEALEKNKTELNTAQTMETLEQGAISGRLERLRDEVAFLSRREREGQELYRARKEELDGLGA